jgi:hypothetical protein
MSIDRYISEPIIEITEPKNSAHLYATACTIKAQNVNFITDNAVPIRSIAVSSHPGFATTAGAGEEGGRTRK